MGTDVPESLKRANLDVSTVEEQAVLLWYWLLWWSYNFGENMPLFMVILSTNISEHHRK